MSNIFGNLIRVAGPCTMNSTVDGPGVRYVIWTQGCPHHCFQCHNPQTHALNGGYWRKMDEILSEIYSLEYHSGITLSGGEPFLQASKLSFLVDEIHRLRPDLTIWCYTGFTYEEIMEDREKRELCQKLDVLVDGKFEWQCPSKKRFKGSENQRIIDVQKSLKKNQVVIFE